MAMLSARRGIGSQISGGNVTHHWYINAPNPREITRQIASFMKSVGVPQFAAASR